MAKGKRASRKTATGFEKKRKEKERNYRDKEKPWLAQNSDFRKITIKPFIAARKVRFPLRWMARAGERDLDGFYGFFFNS